MSAAGRIVNDANRLKDDAYSLGADASAAAREAGDAAEGAAIREAGELAALLERVEDRLAALYETVSAGGARSIETVEDVVEENPWLSLLAAFAAGALATHLLSRR